MRKYMIKKNNNEEEPPTVDYKLGFDSGYNRALTKVQELLQSGKTDSEIINELISMCGTNISNGTFSAIFCKDDDKPVISKNDVKKAIKDTLEEANYIA